MGVRPAAALPARLARRGVGGDEGREADGRASVPDDGRYSEGRFARPAVVVRPGRSFTRSESGSRDRRALRARSGSATRLASVGRGVWHAAPLYSRLVVATAALGAPFLPRRLRPRYDSLCIPRSRAHGERPRGAGHRLRQRLYGAGGFGDDGVGAIGGSTADRWLFAENSQGRDRRDHQSQSDVRWPRPVDHGRVSPAGIRSAQQRRRAQSAPVDLGGVDARQSRAGVSRRATRPRLSHHLRDAVLRARCRFRRWRVDRHHPRDRTTPRVEHVGAACR